MGGGGGDCTFKALTKAGTRTFLLVASLKLTAILLRHIVVLVLIGG